MGKGCGEVAHKVLHELLAMWHLDGAGLDVRHEVATEPGVRVTTTVALTDDRGQRREGRRTDCGRDDTAASSEVHRLLKRNLYHLLRDLLALPSAPWGILHGVRPGKIAQRYLALGLSPQATAARFIDDYDVSAEKAQLLVDLAVFQRPFLATSTPRTVSVYVGIPFCLSRCLYCSFPSNVLPREPNAPANGKPSTLAAFMEAFHRDLASAAQSIEQHRLAVQSIYVGGGTPTSLPDALFDEMLTAVHELLWHDGVAEFTVEAGRPDSITAAKLAAMQRLAVTRVSANPQTMSAATLRRIGRNHTPEDIVAMVGELRRYGFAHINMDLIVGLPGEGVAEMADSIRRVLALAPESVTLHSLALKKGSRLKEVLDVTLLPDDDTVRAMYDLAAAAVTKASYHPYYLYRQGYQSGALENTGYCRPGCESMYNIQIMDEHQTVLGIGGAATSKIVNARTGVLTPSFNPKDLLVYIGKVDDYMAKRERLIDEAYG